MLSADSVMYRHHRAQLSARHQSWLRCDDTHFTTKPQTVDFRSLSHW